MTVRDPTHRGLIQTREDSKTGRRKEGRREEGGRLNLRKEQIDLSIQFSVFLI